MQIGTASVSRADAVPHHAPPPTGSNDLFRRGFAPRLRAHKPSRPVAKSGNAPGSGVDRVIVESADPSPVATIVYRCVTEYLFPEGARAAATLVPIALKRVLPSWVTVAPVVVNRPLAVSIKVCSLTDQPVGKELDVKLLIQLLFTSVLPCEVTKTLRVPAPLGFEMLNEVFPGCSATGLQACR